MNQITDGKYKFTEAALAAGVPPKTLRGWLDRTRDYGLDLDADDGREGMGWRRFSLIDVFRFALARHLIQSCVPVGRAFEIAEDCMQSFGLNTLARYRNVPAKVLLAGILPGFTVWFWPSESASQGWGSYIQKLPHDTFQDEVSQSDQAVVSILFANKVLRRVFENLDLEG